MSVLYFGDPQGALCLLDSGVELLAVVHGRRGGPGWRALIPRVRALPRWTLPDLSDPDLLATFAALAPRLVVSGFYPRKIPRAVLDLAPGINVHPSDLPRWRGPDPVHWALRSGDAQTAICVHWLTEEVDAGDVLLREAQPIGRRDSAGALSSRLEARSAELLAQVALRLLSGEAMEGVPQGSAPTWAPMVDPDEVEIDWTKSAAEVDWLVRSCSPHPGAYTGIEDELLVILQGWPVPAGAFEVLEAGTPFVREGVAHLRCGEGAFRLGRCRLGPRSIDGRRLARLLA